MLLISHQSSSSINSENVKVFLCFLGVCKWNIDVNIDIVLLHGEVADRKTGAQSPK